MYPNKGTATGVLKRHAGFTDENWDEREQHWVDWTGKLVYRIQYAQVEWKNYGK